MRKLWCLEVGKIWEKILTGILSFFFLKTNWREWRGFKRRREKVFRANTKRPRHPPRGGRVGLTGPERVPGRGPHGLPHGEGHTWSHGHFSLSRALSRSSAVSWEFELRFRIRLWITNRDSLTHDYDYKTLKHG